MGLSGNIRQGPGCAAALQAELGVEEQGLNLVLVAVIDGGTGMQDEKGS